MTGSWDGRFGEFRDIVAWDYLRLLRRIAAGQLKTSVSDFAASRLSSLTEQYVAQGDQGVRSGGHHRLEHRPHRRRSARHRP
jgi:hypothetical protein